MHKRGARMKKYLQNYKAYVLLAVAYLIITILEPTSKATERLYHINNLQFRELSFTYILPILAIWFIAFYGLKKLHAYSSAIRRSAEGGPFKDICHGVGWLAYGMPLSAIASSVFVGITRKEPGWHSGFIILNNYIGLLIALGAYTYISRGTRALADTNNIHPPLKGVRVMMLLFVTTGVLYTYYSLRNIKPNTINPYHMPVWLILLTIVIPYLYAWFMGLYAAYEVSLFSKHVKGIVYRKALIFLASGIAAAIIASITLQLFTSLSPRLSHLTLDLTLVLIYVLLVIYSIGYILIAIGANKLKKIEDV
jgi:hypothetical protein